MDIADRGRDTKVVRWQQWWRFGRHPCKVKRVVGARTLVFGGGLRKSYVVSCVRWIYIYIYIYLCVACHMPGRPSRFVPVLLRGRSYSPHLEQGIFLASQEQKHRQKLNTRHSTLLLPPRESQRPWPTLPSPHSPWLARAATLLRANSNSPQPRLSGLSGVSRPLCGWTGIILI